MEFFWLDDSNSRTRDICYWHCSPVHPKVCSKGDKVDDLNPTLMTLPREVRFRILYYVLQPPTKFITLDCLHEVIHRPLVDIGRSRLCSSIIKDDNNELKRGACWGTAATTQVLLVNRCLKEEAEEV